MAREIEDESAIWPLLEELRALTDRLEDAVDKVLDEDARKTGES